MAILLASCLILGDYDNDAAAQGSEKPQYGGILKTVQVGRALPSKFGWPLDSGSGVDYCNALIFYEGLLKAALPPECIEPQLATSWNSLRTRSPTPSI
jgi:hypothetical protein